MLEWLMVPALIGVAALVPGSQSDKKKIQIIFNTIGYGVPDKERKRLITPKFVKKVPIMDQEEEIGTRYFYSIPLGLPASKLADEEKRMTVFSDGLGRPVVVQFKKESKMNPKKYLQISVYHNEITELYPYANVPKQLPIKLPYGKEKMEWLIPLGKTLEGTIWHNFDHIPHLTVSGTTRFGKTVFLKVMFTYLIEHHPEDVEFYIIDLKGGLEFVKYENLKQVKAVASSTPEAFQILKNLTNEYPDEKKGEDYGQLEYEYVDFRRKGISNVVNTNIKKRRFIIVDEGAQMTPGQFMSPIEKAMLIECQAKLSRLAGVGGALGYRVVFATQYPTADTLPRQVKQNADGKITFRLPTSYASDVAIDEHGAEKLPSDVKGRALYKTHELKEMQAPLIEDDEMWELLAPFLNKGEKENESFNQFGKEEKTTRGNFVDFGGATVRNEGTYSADAPPGNRPKRPKNIKRTKAVPPHSEPRREERLLPKRKGKGTGRRNEGGKMEPPSGTSLT
jgi:DNA segregation ATPase FtsK/SpoIIIE, S-DNA-T family